MSGMSGLSGRLACHHLVWPAFALALIAAPQLFGSSLALTVLSQMGYTIVICLSYNLLFGQGGMLSFGHAVYTGLGAFVAIHAMNAAAGGQLALPLVWVPLIGGLGGLAFAALFGWVSTQQAGTPFAMITLGLGELVAAAALMFPGWFGGEGGISTDRVYGTPLFGLEGLDFAAQIQVYHLIAAYCFACTGLMYAFTRTPLGRLLNAVRDQPERVAFIGHNPRVVRYIGFVIAGFFAGVGGGLAAINFEIVNASDSLSTVRSGAYLLFTFLGGASFFLGPIIGALLLVLASVLLSELTPAWLLYLGLAFMLMVLFAPGGVASIVVQHARALRALHRAHALRRAGAPADGPSPWARVLLPYAAVLASGALAFAGLSMWVEMSYHRQLNAASGPVLTWLGWPLDTRVFSPWALGALLLAVGGLALRWAVRRLVRDWSAVQGEMAATNQQNQAQSMAYPSSCAQALHTPVGQAPATSASAAAPTLAKTSAETGAKTSAQTSTQTPVQAAPSTASAPVLELEGVSKRFGQTEVLRGVNLRVHAGERVALIGPNGAGKSTLFNLISGRLTPSSGQLRLAGRSIAGKSPQAISRLGLARSFQISHLFAQLSVVDHLRCAALWPLGHRYTLWRALAGLPDVNARADEVLAMIGLAHKRDALAVNLTYAEQRALEVGVTLAGGAPVILLDEPTAGMSRAETEHFTQLIRRVSEGKTLLTVEHDMGVVFGLADRIAVLVHGEVIAFDTPEAIQANPQVQAAYLGESPEFEAQTA